MRGKRVIWVIGGVAALVAADVLAAHRGLPSIYMQTALSLAFGWLGYLWRVVPQLHLNGLIVAGGSACLAGVLVLGHSTATWFWREMRPPHTGVAERRWRAGWTGVAAALVVLAFAFGIAAAGIVHEAAWLVTSPAPLVARRRWPTAERIKCEANIRQIGLALMAYAGDYDGALPETLAPLLAAGYAERSNFICASAEDDLAPGATPAEQASHLLDGQFFSYVYHGRGLKLPLTPGVPLVSDRPENHQRKGMNILFSDLSIGFVDAEVAEEILSRRVSPAAATPPAAGLAVPVAPVAPHDPASNPSGGRIP